MWAQARTGLRMRRDPLGVLTELHERYGPVFATGAGPLRYVWLIGPDAHRELFSPKLERFSWREATKPLLVVDGETAIVLSDGEDHARRRRIVQPAFSIRRIDGYVPLMVAEIQHTLAGWIPGREFDGYQELRRCVRRIVTRALFGERLSGQADELGDRLQPGLDFLDRPMPHIKIDLPGTPWHRAKVARRRTDELVFAEIDARRRGEAAAGDDVLSWLLEAADPEGSGARLTDQEVRDQVVSLIAAGYETTSAAVGWTLWASLANSDVWERVRAEVGEEPITAERVKTFTYLDGVISEALRLWPPGAVAGRKLLEDIDAAGLRVPAGSIALYSPYVTQRLTEFWPDPLTFRPERWDKGSPDYVEPVPLSYLPFGAGPRRCLGFAFALTEIKVLLAEVVRAADLELLTRQEPSRESIASLRPKGGVRVRVKSARPAPASSNAVHISYERLTDG